MLFCSQTSEGFQGILTPQKLLTEEVIIFTYIEDMVEILTSEEHYKIYAEFLISLLSFKIEEPHIDLFIRQTLEIIERHVRDAKIPADVLKQYWPLLYKQTADLLNLRYNETVCKVLLTSKTPLWHETGIGLMHIAGWVIDPNYAAAKQAASESGHGSCCGSEEELREDKEEVKGLLKSPTSVKKPKPSITIPGEDDFAEDLIRKNKSERKESVVRFSNDDNELRSLAWSSILEALKEFMNIRKSSYFAMEEYLVERIIITSQELGIAVVDFISKVLLPNAKTRADREKLISIIEVGHKAFHKWAYSVRDLENPIKLPYYCLATLLDIAAANEPASQLAIPVLISKTKEMLQYFLKKEKENVDKAVLK
eukprot:TRINITY_DN12990_c1_g1_i5.p1 TRINITY_DN12990_c1_g1~~TRINITY_DN12990_c1_g1_i5.p1  ORF type:complete len:368 (+),score=83.76 TRINITY_DN12990_c1_g1_i5:294-1397(+)